MDSLPTGAAEIKHALNTVHNPRSQSAQRLEAQQYLESLKQNPLCALIGWELNSNGDDGVVRDEYMRHYGLTLLEYAIRYQFQDFDEQKRLAVRQWVMQLAFGIQANDPHFIREKIAYLVVSIAKRVWGLDTRVTIESDDVAPTDGWIELDAQLLELWTRGGVHLELSLSVLRYLFEDVFLLDDPVASGRMNALSTQCIEITASKPDLQVLYSARASELEKLRGAQFSDEGWLARWAAALETTEDQKLYLKLVETIKATLEWVPIVSILSSNVLKVLIQAGSHSDVNVRILACDSLHVLFHARSYNTQVAFDSIIGTVFQPDGIRWLTEVYTASYMATGQVEHANDGLEYMFAKKLVELIVFLGEFVENEKSFSLPSSADFEGYFRLMLEICGHPSLMVSGLVLQFWCSVLRIEKLARIPQVEQLFPRLLRTAVERCINYEDMPRGNLSKQYMEADFDSKQEATQFYKSYQRYMEDILRLMVCRIPLIGMQFIRERMMEYFQSESGWKTMNTVLETKEDPAYVLGCAQFVLVESAIRGASRWQIWAEAEERQQLGDQVTSFMAAWAQEMLELHTVDLEMQRRTIECLVQFAPLLKDNDQLLFKILERVLQACTSELPPEVPEFDEQRERVMELRMASGTELNRLAYMVPEALAKIYDDLERVIADLITTKNIREHESVSFKSFLLVASQRSDMPNKEQKFINIVDPVLARWTEESTIKGLADLEWFLERVGVVQIDQYFRNRGITAATNLLETPIDDAGRQLKAELKQKWQAIFPIRPSRIFIQYTIERLDHQSPEYKYLLSMWKPRVQPILPHILQLIAQIMAYHNPANWKQLPAEVQNFVRISCTERFWQVGISMQTRAEFERANQAASRTLRDFADSVGHVVRYTREYAFLTLGSISQLEETMYEIPGMGTLLARALVSTTEGVTSHAWRHMISLVVRNVVKNCPAAYVKPFLTEFLPSFLSTINQVLVTMWQRQEQCGLQLERDEAPDDEDLSEEMMEEYLLRQLTAITDRLLIDLVGQSSAKVNPRNMSDEYSETAQKFQVRKVCRNTPEILVEVLRLCKNLMVFKDSRCCFNTCLIVRHFLAGPAIHIIEEVSPVFLTEIMPACLKVLSDRFFSESHLEVGTILTLMYVQLPSVRPTPLEELARLLGEAASSERLQQFDREMQESKSLRQQRGVLMEFLTQCRVLEVDDQSRARNKKRVEQRVSVRNVPEEHYDSEALISMFNI